MREGCFPFKYEHTVAVVFQNFVRKFTKLSVQHVRALHTLTNTKMETEGHPKLIRSFYFRASKDLRKQMVQPFHFPIESRIAR